MKKVFLLFAAVVLFPVFVYGQFGVGFEVGNGQKLSLLIPAGPVGIEALVGLDVWDPGSYTSGGIKTDYPSVTYLDLGLALHVPVLKVDDAHLNVYGQFEYLTETDMDAGMDIQFGFAPSVMVSKSIELGGKIGFGYTKYPLEKDSEDDAPIDMGIVASFGAHWML